MKWPDHDEPPACSRLHTWLNVQDAQPISTYTKPKDSIRSILQAASEQIRSARRPLIWLESVDVQCARAAVQLAQSSGATLHVAQSPGAELTSSVSESDGWLGTTLAEVGSTASLVIHIGQQHLRDAPMFELRFANPNAQHLFVDQCPEAWLQDNELQNSCMQLQWTKEMWLDGLTRTLLVLRDESAALARRADAMDVSAGMLAEMLLGSHYSVIVWGEDTLSDELDGLIVRRLLELARLVSRTSRCSLLSLSQDPGRITAKDAVLWLTNRTAPVRFTEGCWTKEPLHYRSLQNWQDTFDWIMCIRNLPTDRQLPELKFDLLVDAHCNIHQPISDSSLAKPPSTVARDAAGLNSPLHVAVSAVGLDTSGHLLRADHGLAAMVQQVASGPTNYPQAAEIVKQLAELSSSAAQSFTAEVR